MYLVQRRIDMLPKPLTEDICSLRGGVERLAFSVIWEVTPQAEVGVRVRGGAGWVGGCGLCWARVQQPESGVTGCRSGVCSFQSLNSPAPTIHTDPIARW